MARSIDLGGQVAVVTGGGAGIGGGISEALAGAGAHVVVVDVDEGFATSRVAAVTDAGGSAEALVLDVRDRDAVAHLADHVLSTHGKLDILVNNVGHYLTPTPFEQSDEDHWDALDAVNFTHVLRCTRAFLPSMLGRESGVVVNVSSVEGLRGYPADPVYAAYKAAVNHFTRCLALDVAGRGVRVHAIAPDLTHTLQVDYDQTIPEELRDRWRIWAPLGRAGTPADNADVVLFLVSDLARFLVGHVIPTDAGSVNAGGWFRTVRAGKWTNRPRNP